MKRIIWLLPILLTFFVTGCLKEDTESNTLVLLGTESEVQTYDEMEGLDTLRTFLLDSMALSLPTGNFPPDVQGKFTFDLITLESYNNHHHIPNGSLEIQLDNQHNRLISNCEVVLDVTLDPQQAYVMGDSNGNFTVYFTVTKEFKPSADDVFTYLQTIGCVITGTVDALDEAVVVATVVIDIEIKTPSSSANGSYLSEKVLSTKNDILVYRGYNNVVR